MTDTTPKPGFFISLEGIDRSGKSTQAALLAEALGGATLLVREPGGTPLGEEVRTLLKDPSIALDARAEALLFAAARAALVADVIRPALADGITVISDRYIDSSLAYQGVVRGLGIAEVAQINAWATGDLQPDLTILVTIDPERAAARGAELGDRFEDEGLEFQRQVAAAYGQLAAAAPERIVSVDGDRSAETVAIDLLALVQARFAAVTA